MNAVVAFFARSPVAANVLAGITILAGVMTAWGMQRDTFPKVTTDVVAVTVLYPGAAPGDVEQSVVRVVEEEVAGLDGIKEVVGVAREGHASVRIEFVEGTDIRKATEDVRNAVEGITTFPTRAERPVVAQVDQPDVVAFCVISGDVSERALREWALDIEERIIDEGITNKIRFDAMRDREIRIEVRPEDLEAHDLTIDEVADAVAAASGDLPAGDLETARQEFLVRMKARREAPSAFADILVRGDPRGAEVRLGEVASLRWGFEDVPIRARYNGRPAILMTVLKDADQDVLRVDRELQDFIAAATGDDDRSGWLPPEIHLDCTFTFAELVQGRLWLLTKNGLIGLVLVFLTLWFFTDIAVAFWVSVGLPVALGGTLWLLGVADQNINMISMFALIMGVGILVDDAIIVSENIYAKVDEGKEPMDAVVGGTQQVVIPVIGAALTSIAAFLPLAMVPGTVGRYMMVLPITIAAGLAFSLIECLLILPHHLRHGMRRRRRLLDRGRLRTNRVRAAIDGGMDLIGRRLVAPLGDFVVRFRYLVLATALAASVISVALIKADVIPWRFFPTPEGDMLSVTVRFPAGTPAATTARQIAAFEEEIEATEKALAGSADSGLVRHVSSVIGGQASVRGEAASVGGHLGSILVVLESGEHRTLSLREFRDRLIDRCAERTLPGLRSFVIEEPARGPGGKDVDIRIAGDDWTRVREAVRRVRTALEDHEEVINVDDDLALGKEELLIEPTWETGPLGASAAGTGRTLRTAFYGGEPVKIQSGRDEIVARVRLDLGETASREDLLATRVRLASGHRVPVETVGELRTRREIEQIKHLDGHRVVAVTASITSETSSDEVLAALGREGDGRLAGLLGELSRELDVRFLFEGIAATQGETMSGIRRGAIVGLVCIFLVLVLSFGSWWQPAVILSCIPVGFVGAVAGHAAFGLPFTMISVFGVVGLTGIVVNDAITLIHFINLHRDDGKPLADAVRAAMRARFRAIIMTTATTVLGLLPLILERSLQAQYLIPMAVAISVGLIAATIGTLTVVPALFLAIRDGIGILQWMQKGRHPLRHYDE